MGVGPSGDLDYLYIFLFLLPIEASYKIWLRLAKGFKRRRSLKMVDDDDDGRMTDDGRTTDDGWTPGACLFFEFTREPSTQAS